MTRVLIVDDEPFNLYTLEALLAPEGYELSFASTSDEAWRQASEQRPDIILLDVMMPGGDGYQLCRQLRHSEGLREVSIILVTALDDAQSRLKGLEAGADDFLTKPVQKDELRARLRTIASLNRFRQIAEQRERFQRLFELTPSATLLVDLRGQIVTANECTRHLLQPGAETIDGQPLEGWFDQETRPRIAGLLEFAQQADRAGALPPIQLERERGQQIYSLRASLLREKSQPLVLLVLDDITAEVRARENLQRFNRELEDQVRARTAQLEEANTLLMSYASFVSHDLRSPLAVLKGYLSLLTSGTVTVSSDSAPMIEQCLEASNVMADLIDNILQLAREEHAAAPVQAVDPTPIVRRVINHVVGVGSGRKPEFKVGALPVCPVRAPLLERVFYNLISNAVKYTAHCTPARIEIGGRETPEGVMLFVRDNGAGFDQRQVAQLFREFSRLDTASDTDGVGLGLALVARLLRAHRARIWAEGKVGEGAVFYVQFPVVVDAAMEPAPACPLVLS